MRQKNFHRWMLHLGMAAVLALILVPSMGRLATDVPVSAAHAMHSIHGADVTVVATGHEAATPAPVAPRGDTGVDCDYCPLLASLVTPALPQMPAITQADHRRADAAAASPRLPYRHPSGLGSRGPPAA